MALGSHSATARACCGSRAPLTLSAVPPPFLSSVTPVLRSWDAWIHGNFLTLEKSKSFNSAGNSQENSWSGCSSDPSPSTPVGQQQQRHHPFSRGLHALLKGYPKSCCGLAIPGWVWGFPGGSVGKESGCDQEMQEAQVQSLGQEDPAEEGMAAHSSILAWRIPWTEEPGGLQSTGSQRVRHD